MALEALETRDLSFAACCASRHIEESAGGGTSVAPGRPLRSPASLSLASSHPPQMPLRALQQEAVWAAGKSRRLAGGEPGSSPSFACEGSPHPGDESSPLPGAVRAHVTIHTRTLGKPQGISFPSAATSHVSTDPGLRLFRTLIHRRLPLVSDALPGCPFLPWFVRAHLKPGLPGPCWLLSCLPLLPCGACVQDGADATGSSSGALSESSSVPNPKHLPPPPPLFHFTSLENQNTF